MSEYRSVITVNADADEVFGFVCDPDNMPKYLPTVRSAELQSPGRVRIQGESPRGPYDSDGELRIDETSRRMEWGSDGENRYRGWLQVAGDEQSCQVTVRLLFDPNPRLKEAMDAQMGDRDASINESLRNALKAVKAIFEGAPVPTGGVAYADNPPSG